MGDAIVLTVSQDELKAGMKTLRYAPDDIDFVFFYAKKPVGKVIAVSRSASVVRKDGVSDIRFENISFFDEPRPLSDFGMKRGPGTLAYIRGEAPLCPQKQCAPSSVPSYTLYTDGGCSPNPGRGGYGGVILFESGFLREYSGGSSYTTNNVMELTAIFEGLKLIPKNASVIIYSDSQYAINSVSGVWNGAQNRSLIQQIRSALSAFPDYDLRCVRGHCGDKWNERADELASEQIQKKQNSKTKNASRASGKTGGSMAAAIPESLKSIYSDYPSEDQVHKQCAESIRRFNQKCRHSFKDYMQLKTGGRDGFSSLNSEDLCLILGDDLMDSFRSIAYNEREVLYCARWYLRGLSAYDSCRKVLVDAEVRDNAAKSKKHRR